MKDRQARNWFGIEKICYIIYSPKIFVNILKGTAMAVSEGRPLCEIRVYSNFKATKLRLLIKVSRCKVQPDQSEIVQNCTWVKFAGPWQVLKPHWSRTSLHLHLVTNVSLSKRGSCVLYYRLKANSSISTYRLDSIPLPTFTIVTGGGIS